MRDQHAFDNTILSAFRTCPRLFYLRHQRNWVPDVKSTALIFGGAWHSAMDVVWSSWHLFRNGPISADTRNAIARDAYLAFVAHWVDSGLKHPDELTIDDLDELTPRTPGIALEMINAYIEKRERLFSDPSFELISVEQAFSVPLDPDPANPLRYVGRLDKIARYQNRTWIFEHKTTSSYRKSPTVPFRSDFLDSFSPNSQLDGYVFALRLMHGNDAAGIQVDAALVHREVHDGFVIIPVDRHTHMTDAFIWNVRYWVDAIEDNRAALASRPNPELDPYLVAFPQNTAACGNYGGCAYRDICCTVANPAQLKEPPLGYRVEVWDPLEKLMNVPVKKGAA